jgi:hypothetical protein
MKGENWLQVFLDEQYVNKVVLRLLNMVSRWEIVNDKCRILYIIMIDVKYLLE